MIFGDAVSELGFKFPAGIPNYLWYGSSVKKLVFRPKEMFADQTKGTGLESGNNQEAAKNNWSDHGAKHHCQHSSEGDAVYDVLNVYSSLYMSER